MAEVCGWSEVLLQSTWLLMVLCELKFRERGESKRGVEGRCKYQMSLLTNQPYNVWLTQSCFILRLGVKYTRTNRKQDKERAIVCVYHLSSGTPVRNAVLMLPVTPPLVMSSLCSLSSCFRWRSEFALLRRLFHLLRS